MSKLFKSLRHPFTLICVLFIFVFGGLCVRQYAQPHYFTPMLLAGDITDTGYSQKDMVTYFENVRDYCNAVGDRLKSVTLAPAGLIIEPTGSKTCKTADQVTVCVVDGTFVSIGTGTTMPAIPTTAPIQNNSSNIVLFAVNSSGTRTAVIGTEGSSTSAITAPTVSDTVAVIGGVLIENASGADFEPGTTALDASGITATIFDITGAFDLVPNTDLTLKGL